MIESLFEHRKFICLSVDLIEDIKSLYCNWTKRNGLEQCALCWSEDAFIEIIRDYHSICVPFNWVFHLFCVKYLMIVIESFLFMDARTMADDNSTFYTNISSDCYYIAFIERLIKISSGQHGYRDAGKSNVIHFTCLDFQLRYIFYRVFMFAIDKTDRNRKKTNDFMRRKTCFSAIIHRLWHKRWTELKLPSWYWSHCLHWMCVIYQGKTNAEGELV